MLFKSIRVILVATSHPGNIGSTARAMKTMGLERLYLVSPHIFPDRIAHELSAGADDILEQAVLTDSLEAALIGCRLAFATSARPRDLSLPGLTPVQAAINIAKEADDTEIAIVFGREHAGLTNDELLQCQYHINIPSDPNFSSLNLAQAVQIMAYELRMHLLSPQAEVKMRPSALATIEEVEQFYTHLCEMMLAIDFLKPSNPKKLLKRMRRLFNRTQLETVEVKILRGILTHITDTLRGNLKIAHNSNIYLDYMATTPVDPLALKSMLPYLCDNFGNPSSNTHNHGRIAALAIEHARAQVAMAIGATTTDIVFSSGATEANNLAILGAARFYKRKGMHIITMSTEHKSVLDSCRQLEQEGFEVSYLNPQSDGILNLLTLEQALRPDTIMVSIMQVNNEIGVIQDIEGIGALLRGRGIIFHVDAAQSAGKVEINLQKLAVDLMSFSAHKNYGPKGIGALYIRHKPRIRLYPQSFGGGQEGGLRAGTLATHQIVGMGTAFALAESIRLSEQERILALRLQLWDGIKHLPGIHLNGSATQRIASNLNLSFDGLNSADILSSLSMLAISTASACSSSSLEPSYVLRALGLGISAAKSSIRLSLGRFTDNAQVQIAINTICEHIPRLQAHSNLI